MLQFTSLVYSWNDINLFKRPEYLASPPIVVESIYFGLNLLINLGSTSAPFTKGPTSGNPRFTMGVITASSAWGFNFSSRYPCGSM